MAPCAWTTAETGELSAPWCRIRGTAACSSACGKRPGAFSVAKVKNQESPYEKLFLKIDTPNFYLEQPSRRVFFRIHLAHIKHNLFQQNKGKPPFTRQCSGVNCQDPRSWRFWRDKLPRRRFRWCCRSPEWPVGPETQELRRRYAELEALQPQSEGKETPEFVVRRLGTGGQAGGNVENLTTLEGKTPPNGTFDAFWGLCRV